MKFSFSLVFVAISTIATSAHADHPATARSLRTELVEDTSCSFVCLRTNNVAHVIRPPVMDENGKVYENECEKCKAKKKDAKGDKKSPNDSGSDDSTVQLGNNAEDTSCNFVCLHTKNMAHVIRPPVIDENGKVYENECVMKQEKCKEKKKDVKGGNKSPSDSGSDDSTVQLDNFCPQNCLHVYDPVTDENGKTYRNECQMRRAKCKRKRKHGGGNIGDLLEEYERIYGDTSLKTQH